MGSLTVVDLADRILPSILDETGSPYDTGVFGKERDPVLFVRQRGGIYRRPRLPQERRRAVDFDLLVMAVGVRPNVELVKEAGGAVGRGIQVDASGRTSLPDVYAAGDCTETTDITTGENRVLALLPNAYMQENAPGCIWRPGTVICTIRRFP